MALIWEGETNFTVRCLANGIKRTYNDFDFALAVFEDCVRGEENVDPFWNLPEKEGRELVRHIEMLASLLGIPVAQIKLVPVDPFEIMGVPLFKRAM